MIDVGATIAGAITGFGASVIAPAVEYFQTKQQNRFELDKMDKQMEMAKEGAKHELKMYATKADDEEHARLVDHAKSMVSGSLRSLVRPVYAFTFLGMFVAYKISVIAIGIYQGISAIDIAASVWDSPTQAIFATVVCFYFGGRRFEKALSMVKRR